MKAAVNRDTDARSTASAVTTRGRGHLVSDPGESEVLLAARDRFREAATRFAVGGDTAEALWSELAGSGHCAAPSGEGLRRDGQPFRQTTLLSRSVRVSLYLGAFLLIGSFGWWAYDLHVGLGGLLALSLVYAGGFFAVALYAQARGLDELVPPASVIVAFYVPVIVFACLGLAGIHFAFRDEGVSAFYEWVSGGWIWLELAAIAGAAVLYARFRAPLLLLPLSVFSLFLAMDGTARVVGIDGDSSDRAIGTWVLVFAALVIASGAWLDYGGLRRHAFWPHVFGAVGAVTGIELLLAGTSWELALILSGAAFVLLGIWLGRIAYLVAGGLALWCGITALEPSTIVLTLSGLALVGVSVWLSLAHSPPRRWLQTRTLPPPQRD